MGALFKHLNYIHIKGERERGGGGSYLVLSSPEPPIFAGPADLCSIYDQDFGLVLDSDRLVTWSLTVYVFISADPTLQFINIIDSPQNKTSKIILTTPSILRLILLQPYTFHTNTFTHIS